MVEITRMGEKLVTWVPTINLLLSVVVTIIIAVSRWAMKVNKKESDLQAEISGKVPLEAQIKREEERRMDQFATLEQRIDDQDAEIESLHKKASDEGTRTQKMVGETDLKMARMDKDIESNKRRIKDLEDRLNRISEAADRRKIPQGRD